MSSKVVDVRAKIPIRRGDAVVAGGWTALNARLERRAALTTAAVCAVFAPERPHARLRNR